MSYAKALKQYHTAEKALQGALERLKAARENGPPDRITSARLAAVEAEAAASKAWELVEDLRRLHWQKRATDAEQRLHREALPLLSEVLQYRKWAMTPGLPISPVEIVRHLIAQNLPPVAAGKDDAPVDPLDSSLLDEADEVL